MKYKVIVAHPGQQHSYKVATALKKAGLLYKYFTCIYDKQDSFWMKIAHFVTFGKDIKRIQNRKCEFLEDKDVEIYYTFLSLVVIILSRFTFTVKFSNWLDRKISDSFGMKVAKYAMKHNVDAVICFSTNETKCFEYLKKYAPHIKRICDCANAPMTYMQYIYEQDMKQFNHRELKKEVPEFWDKKVIEKERIGQKYTDCFLAPSTFVSKGLEFCGIHKEQIFILPYGSNFDITEKQVNSSKEIRFLYVGQVTHRKGMHHLLNVFSKLKYDNIFLDIVGSINKFSNLYEKYKDCKNICFYGSVLHSEVKKFLLKDDIFVFPSLTEGFSLACLEASSYGLPLIVSNNSGANDMIKNGCNGFTFDSSDEICLEKCIKYFIENKNEIPKFSKNILETANNYTWEKYNINIARKINIILKKRVDF